MRWNVSVLKPKSDLSRDEREYSEQKGSPFALPFSHLESLLYCFPSYLHPLLLHSDICKRLLNPCFLPLHLHNWARVDQSDIIYTDKHGKRTDLAPFGLHIVPNILFSCPPHPKTSSSLFITSTPDSFSLFAAAICIQSCTGCVGESLKQVNVFPYLCRACRNTCKCEYEWSESGSGSGCRARASDQLDGGYTDECCCPGTNQPPVPAVIPHTIEGMVRSRTLARIFAKVRPAHCLRAAPLHSRPDVDPDRELENVFASMHKILINAIYLGYGRL